LYAIFPLLILFLPLLIQERSALPTSIEQNLYYLPYFIFIIGLVLCWLFYNSREFNLLLILGASFWSLQNYLWDAALSTTQKIVLFDLLCVFIPINFAIFNFLKERGILNQHGIKRLSFVAIQIALITWLVVTNKFNIFNLFDVQIYPSYTSVIKQPALIIMSISLLVLITDWVIRGGQLRYAWILILAAIMLALHHVNDKQITTVYFVLAGIITITAIIIHSYHLAYKDELTQLPSRRALKQKLASLGKTYSIAMADVDHFKKLNDTYGHDVGDDVLKMLATHLSEVEGGGKTYRYGGEEFAIIFPDKDAKSAAVYLEALRVKIDSTPFIIRHKKRPRKKPEITNETASTKQLNVTISIGVTNKKDSHLTPQDVMKSADKALYRAKKGGRNKVII
jgi:diguanylate cyclase (GGDEF)-like protein